MNLANNSKPFGALRSLLACLLGAGLSVGCLAEEPVTGDASYEARGGRGDTGGGKPDKGGSSAEGVSCTTEVAEPAAKGSIVIDGDPTRATAVEVVATNHSDQPRLIGARLRAQVGGQRRTVERAASYVRPGASASIRFELRELGIDPTTAELPSRLSGALIVLAEDGSFVERVPTDSVDVGPSVDVALDNLLRGRRIRSRELTSTDIKGLTATIISIDQGDHGLTVDALDDPDDDGGIPTIPPTYSDAVPDENGMYQHNFCLRWPVDLVDAGFGEDYGIEAEASWKARGGKVKITSHDEVLFDGYLDFNGCTGEIESPYHTDFWMIGYSYAKIYGNTIIAKDENNNTHGWLRLVDEVGGSGTKYYDLAPGSLSNLVAVPAFTLARFGGVTNETFVVNEACYTEGEGCCNCAAGGEIWISSTQRKFLIAHEMGHRILAIRTGGYNNDCDLDVFDQSPCFSSSGHAIDSMEYQSCAAMEGWAHFVAVRAFNDNWEEDNPGAILQYWRDSGLTVNVEQGPDGGVDTYFEAVCQGGQANLDSGFGVELDWLRTWWDYHTNPSPGSVPSQSQMMDEIASNPAWTRETTYQFVTDGIEATSGTTQRDRWTAIATANGIDH